MKNKLFLMLALSSVWVTFGQDAPGVRKGTFEVGGFVGSSFGLETYRFMGGGNVGYAVQKWLFPYAEVSYLPGIARAETTATTKVTYKIPFTDFHGGVHLLAPLPGSRFALYGIVGVGLLHAGSGFGIGTQNVGGLQVPFNPPVASSTDVATNFGGGARYYIKEGFGIRFEAKVYKPTGRFTDTFGRIAGGIFWQF
jgi:hypothetical protein